ncbi:IS6 family transposase [Natronococcus sp. A-GB1]|uniref:IS6 family transposase n=1 Tax=Natronococcus sp. A-GB1 TaxID=3037648 RepID=UPI00241E125C|nr:IS6 family transposase [Natronococcus sp. A-GB1]MDG5761551.1 IS6 family transposase [Natronococcus sp. A-GB1]
MLADLLSECYAAEFDQSWERERTVVPFETQAIFRLVGVERTHQAIWHWVHRLADSAPDPPTASPSRVAVNETAVKINGDWSWVYTAIDLDSRLILDVAVFGRRGTDPAAAFLHQLTENHELDGTVFLVDGYGYLTALSQLGLSGQLDYVDRNRIEKWFHTLKMSVDHFYNSRMDSRASAREWVEQFVHYCNQYRPCQFLDRRAPADEVIN